MRLLVTRPKAQAAELARELQALGHETLACPLLEPRFEGQLPTLKDFGALVFTSRNGVAAFTRLTRERGLPAFCVGDATREAALAAGFERVISAEGDAEALAEVLLRKWKAEEGQLLHASGAEQAHDLAGTLKAGGLEAERVVLYRMEPLERLPESVRTALSEGDLDAALFFSPRTAKVFVSLCEREGLGERCRTLAAFCLSPAIADAASALPWRAIRAAERPNRQSLVELLSG